MIEFNADVLNYPGRSDDVFTTNAFIERGFCDDVDKKFSHLIKYVRLLLIKCLYGHIYNFDNP